MRNFFLVFFLFASLYAPAQITTSTSLLNFFTVFVGAPDSMSLVVQNNSATDYVVSDVRSYHDAFTVNPTQFVVPAGGSYSVWVKCDPRHNVKYADYLYFISSSHPEPLAVFAYAFARYSDPYYDLTQDKYHEDLKASLKTIVNFGATDLSYNLARDSIFMNVDNERVNGGGASQNTLECVYTGTVITGYLNRSDAQTNYNFNTEHTFPQSLFSSNWPMVADMHHLFAVTSTANTERSNKPFSVVTSPTWTQGGSKANGTYFEPRDLQKGVTARALLYFVTRFQDFSGWTAPQEALLRQWSSDFPPTASEVNRNDIIYRIQSNRNPYTDHPEFLERIASVTTVNNGPTAPVLYQSGDTLFFADVPSGSTVQGQFHLSNQGWSEMAVGNFVLNDPAYTFANTPPTAVKKDSVKTLLIDFSPGQPNQTYQSTLTFTTDDPARPAVTVYLKGTSIEAGLEDALGIQAPYCWPNPSHGMVKLSRGGWLGDLSFSIVDLHGRTVRRGKLLRAEEATELPMNGLARGQWLVKVQMENGENHTLKMNWMGQ